MFAIRIAHSAVLCLLTVGLSMASASEKGPWPAYSLAVSSDGKWLAAADQSVSSNRSEAWVRLIELRSGREVRQLRLPQQGSAVLRSLLFSPDAKVLAWGGYGRVHVFDVATGRRSAQFHGYQSNFDSLSFSPGGEFIAAANADKHIAVWGATRWQDAPEVFPGLRIGPHDGAVSAVAFWPVRALDENVIASSSGNQIQLWNVQTGRPLREIKPSGDRYVRDLAWSPDGRFIVAAGDGFVWLGHGISNRDVNPDRPLRHLNIDTTFYQVAFSPDGRTFAARDRSSIRVWETGIYENQAGKMLGTMQLPIAESSEEIPNYVHSMVFTPDGAKILFSHGLGDIGAFDVKTGDFVLNENDVFRDHAPEPSAFEEPDAAREEYLSRLWQRLLNERRRVDDVLRDEPELSDVAEYVFRGEPRHPYDVRHIDYFRQINEQNMAEVWGRLHVPVLALVGEYDVRTSQFEHEYIADITNFHTPGSGTWKVLPRLDHGFALHESMQDAVANEFKGRFGTAVVSESVDWMNGVFSNEKVME